MTNSEIISQDELNNLLQLNEFIENQKNHALVSEIKKAILDSGKLQLGQWESLRAHIREVEELIPHIDLIIKLKKEK